MVYEMLRYALVLSFEIKVKVDPIHVTYHTNLPQSFTHVRWNETGSLLCAR